MNIELSSLLFYLLAGLTIVGGLAVILTANPIYCALLLVMTMLGIAGLFFTLGAYFIAAAQLIIYAGAVMVLFVMVLMLFNLREETRAFSRGAIRFLVKMTAAGFLLGFLFSSVRLGVQKFGQSATVLKPIEDGMGATRELAMRLFTHHLFSFELIGFLLLVVLVGAIALARSKGGTHA